MLREQAARAEAEAANRAKDHLLATLSHELRTPLTPVLTTVTAILERPDTPEPMRPVMEMIRRNLNMEVRLIDDLLDLTRDPRRQAASQARGRRRARADPSRRRDLPRRPQRAGLHLDLDLAARRHDIDADPIRLQQILWNLLKNAIKFTPVGGTVTVRTRDGDREGNGDGRRDAARSDEC